jgi:hypothetical protein
VDAGAIAGCKQQGMNLGERCDISGSRTGVQEYGLLDGEPVRVM